MKKILLLAAATLFAVGCQKAMTDAEKNGQENTVEAKGIVFTLGSEDVTKSELTVVGGEKHMAWYAEHDRFGIYFNGDVEPSADWSTFNAAAVSANWNTLHNGAWSIAEYKATRSTAGQNKRDAAMVAANDDNVLVYNSRTPVANFRAFYPYSNNSVDASKPYLPNLNGVQVQLNPEAHGITEKMVLLGVGSVDAAAGANNGYDNAIVAKKTPLNTLKYAANFLRYDVSFLDPVPAVGAPGANYYRQRYGNGWQRFGKWNSVTTEMKQVVVASTGLAPVTPIAPSYLTWGASATWTMTNGSNEANLVTQANLNPDMVSRQVSVRTDFASTADLNVDWNTYSGYSVANFVNRSAYPAGVVEDYQIDYVFGGGNFIYKTPVRATASRYNAGVPTLSTSNSWPSAFSTANQVAQGTQIVLGPHNAGTANAKFDIDALPYYVYRDATTMRLVVVLNENFRTAVNGSATTLQGIFITINTVRFGENNYNLSGGWELVSKVALTDAEILALGTSVYANTGLMAITLLENTSIPAGAFTNLTNPNLSYLNLPLVNDVDVTAFGGWYTDVYMPSYQFDDQVITSNWVTTNRILKKTNLINADLSAVRIFGANFAANRMELEGFSSLRWLKISDVPGQVTIYDNAFSGCTNLYAINNGSLPKTAPAATEKLLDLTKVNTQFGVNAFFNCSSFVTVNLPVGTINIPTGMFYQATSMKTVGNFAGVTNKIGIEAFRNAINFNAPSINAVVIEKDAFNGCRSLVGEQGVTPTTQTNTILYVPNLVTLQPGVFAGIMNPISAPALPYGYIDFGSVTAINGAASAVASPIVAVMKEIKFAKTFSVNSGAFVFGNYNATAGVKLFIPNSFPPVIGSLNPDPTNVVVNRITKELTWPAASGNLQQFNQIYSYIP